MSTRNVNLNVQTWYANNTEACDKILIITYMYISYKNNSLWVTINSIYTNAEKAEVFLSCLDDSKAICYKPQNTQTHYCQVSVFIV